MLMVGGAMAGYCDTGRERIDSAPASITMMPTTQAKMGRSMKNWATGAPRALRDRLPGRLLGAAGRHRDHFRARPDLLHALDDHLIAGLETARDEPGVPHRTIGDELAALHLLLAVHDERRGQPLLVAGHTRLRDEQRLRVHALGETGADEHAGQELALRVREECAERDRARAGIDGHVGELERARAGVGAPVLEEELHLRAAARARCSWPL